MSKTVDLYRISHLFELGAITPAIQDAIKHLDSEQEFDFEKFDTEFEKLIDQEEWDLNDCIRLSGLFFARAVEMTHSDIASESEDKRDSKEENQR